MKFCHQEWHSFTWQSCGSRKGNLPGRKLGKSHSALNTWLKTARGWTGLFCLTALLSPCYLLPCHFFKPLCGNGLSRASGVVLLAFLYYSSILRTAKSRFPIIIIFSFLFKIFFKFSKMYLESTSEFLLLLKTLQSQQGERLFLL